MTQQRGAIFAAAWSAQRAAYGNAGDLKPSPSQLCEAYVRWRAPELTEEGVDHFTAELLNDLHHCPYTTIEAMRIELIAEGLIPSDPVPGSPVEGTTYVRRSDEGAEKIIWSASAWHRFMVFKKAGET
jgi:hypothetical protein